MTTAVRCQGKGTHMSASSAKGTSFDASAPSKNAMPCKPQRHGVVAAPHQCDVRGQVDYNCCVMVRLPHAAFQAGALLTHS